MNYMFFLYEFSREVIVLIFERGAFLKIHGDKTTLALKCYLVGLPFYGIYKIFAPTFYAIDRPKYPINISIVSISLNIIFCVYFTPIYGFSILALGTSLSMMMNSLLQGFYLNKFLHLKWGFFFNKRFFKLIFCSSLSFLCVRWIHPFFFLERGVWWIFLNLALLGGIYLATYGAALFVTGERELMTSMLKKLIKNKNKG